MNLNSAAELGSWVSQRLGQPDQVDHLLRVLTRETGRWNAAPRTQILELVSKPARTGNPKWDALIEGIVAYRLNRAEVSAPDWTKATSLNVGWNPYDDSDTPTAPQWALLDTLETPVEILDKGVTFSRRNMELM